MFLPGILILLIFAVFAGLMMSRRMPALLALPAMAVSIATVSGCFYDWSAVSPDSAGPHSWIDLVLNDVLSAGPSKLANAMIYAAFGSVLSQLVIRTGIAARLISLAAEYAGESKYRLSAVMTLVVALCFTSVTGLGAVIMIGSLVLPILIGAGVSATFATSLMLFAIAWGGIYNPAIFGFYADTLHLELPTVHKFVVIYGAAMGITTLAYFSIQGWRERKSFNWSAPVSIPETKNVPFWALFTPVLPIALILIFSCPIIPAFVVSLIYGAVTTRSSSIISTLTAAILEGLKDVAPVLGLFMGIGMALNAVSAEPTKAVLAPILQNIVPTTPFAFVLFFSLLAPLALYRGPLNFMGLGAGVAGLMCNANILPGTAVMAAFLSVGQIQGVCDPTNTHNVWLAQFSKISTMDLLRQTLPYVWSYAAIALVISVYFMGALK